MTYRIEALFPNLVETGYRITSPESRKYNCIAWAVGDDKNWWWPDTDAWPDDITAEENLETFIRLFNAFGYDICQSDLLEDGFERVAIYTDRSDIPTHVAKQLPNGKWTSKLGSLEDIEHSLQALEGREYGKVVMIMKRVRNFHRKNK